ncbi:MAG TPA: hypothetical protein VFE41_02470 [Acetobacteraceae bacterium]|nr:hypothetical protein [Acetobacteraceae bacterium]
MRHWKPPEPNLFQTQALNILSLPLRKQALELFRILFRETMSAAASENKNPRSKLRGIGGRKEADQKNAASCGEYVPKEIQNAVRQKPSGEQL